jgi:hypothetical protein
MKIDRNNLNMAIDALSVGLMVSLAMTGLLAANWREMNAWIGAAFLAVLALHLVRHWSWVESTRRKLLHIPRRHSRMYRT